jgi:hypothetical protein
VKVESDSKHVCVVHLSLFVVNRIYTNPLHTTPFSFSSLLLVLEVSTIQ